MFSDDSIEYSILGDVFLSKSDASSTYATKADIPTLSGGLSVGTADVRYAPINGSTVYATKSEVPDVTGKANVTDVVAALNLKADANHNHTGVYQPVGSYLVAADIAGKANTSDVTTALAGKADVAHAHAQYAPATGSTVYATKDEVTEATGGGLTQTAADGRYVQQTALYQEVTVWSDQAYAPINGSTVYATKSEIPDVTGFVTDQELADGLGTKANTTHNHDGTYAPASHTHADYALQTDTYSKLAVDTALAGKAPLVHDHPQYQPLGDYAPATGSTVYQTFSNMDRVGSETTYYSKARVDALLTGIGGGGSTPKIMRLKCDLSSAGTTSPWWVVGPTWTAIAGNTSDLTNAPYAIVNDTTRGQLLIVSCRYVFHSPNTGERKIELGMIPASQGPYNSATMSHYTSYQNGANNGRIVIGEVHVTHNTAGTNTSIHVSASFILPVGAWFGLSAYGNPNSIGVAEMDITAFAL